MSTKPIKYELFQFDRHGEVTGACAIGAAHLATGTHSHLVVEEIVFPVLVEIVANPETLVNHTVAGIVVQLNDVYGWTREAIADWVETVERAVDEKNHVSVNQQEQPIPVG